MHGLFHCLNLLSHVLIFYRVYRNEDEIPGLLFAMVLYWTFYSVMSKRCVSREILSIYKSTGFIFVYFIMYSIFI